ncbi:hypothetical protein PoB_005551400 [Plakobranchus ocellatus]|uniref:Uncharacterized protein n=1 Tax=Plakobranchus ocellatus TaxID=259542 RepID=A0AAV4CE41_9GAST|nr:hypothetical protein PoB_005551400 [Plakobranchus ocellatus]
MISCHPLYSCCQQLVLTGSFYHKASDRLAYGRKEEEEEEKEEEEKEEEDEEMEMEKEEDAVADGHENGEEIDKEGEYEQEEKAHKYQGEEMVEEKVTFGGQH